MISVRGLTVGFAPRGPDVLRGVDMHIAAGEIVGLAGPSGCGKTVLCTALLGMPEPPGRVRAGSVVWNGAGGCLELTSLGEKEWRRVRGAQISMIFQDPRAALNPTRRVRGQFYDALRAHARGEGRSAHEVRARGLLRDVGFGDAGEIMGSYPFELSGGMCQRVCIAMALAHAPRLLIADEPTTALDVKSRAGVLELLLRARREAGTAILLVSHDAALLSGTADRVLRMRQGKIEGAG